MNYSEESNQLAVQSQWRGYPKPSTGTSGTRGTDRGTSTPTTVLTTGTTTSVLFSPRVQTGRPA
ncbi:MAG: hypothetical protein KKA90_02770 [Nanoarchaeota archaeon]|nr:hypothetical protein [Nanoarchaeota archaeon]